MTDSIEFDLIIAGSGLAGLRAAIEAAKKNSKINNKNFKHKKRVK